jgi:hypothetical protein
MPMPFEASWAARASKGKKMDVTLAFECAARAAKRTEPERHPPVVVARVDADSMRSQQ